MQKKIIVPTSAHVSSASILDLVDACLALKIISIDSLEKLQLSRNLLLNPEERIEEQKVIALWQYLTDHCEIPHFALLVGQQINPQAKGLLASWVSQCATLGEALQVFTQHIALMNPSEQWQIKTQGNLACLTFHFSTDKNYPACAIERSMSALIAWGQVLAMEKIHIERAEFTFSQPKHLDHYGELFGDKLEFNGTANTLLFKKSILERPIYSSNHYLKEMVKEKALSILNAWQAGAPLSQHILQLIQINLPKQKACIEILCDELSISRQTLYRKLQEEGTDFKTLHTQARKELALKLLIENSHNMASISQALGFKETSSFYKAFKRWFGVSARDYTI